MKEKIGQVFDIAKDNPPLRGCTVSKEIHGGENSISYFSLAKDTDISPEIYPYYKLVILLSGSLEVYGSDGLLKNLQLGEGILTAINRPVGFRTREDSVYIELGLRKETKMNEVIKAGEVFKLKDLIPYGEDKIVNMDLMSNDKMKFVLMAFDKGTGLSEHAAPGSALILALDGEAVIGYEGQDHLIRAGENFHFAKGGLHSVKATENFKMALILTLE